MNAMFWAICVNIYNDSKKPEIKKPSRILGTVSPKPKFTVPLSKFKEGHGFNVTT